MFKRFRQYRPFIDAGIQGSMAFRLDFLLFRLGDILGAVVTYFCGVLFLMPQHTQL